MGPKKGLIKILIIPQFFQNFRHGLWVGSGRKRGRGKGVGIYYSEGGGFSQTKAVVSF